MLKKKQQQTTNILKFSKHQPISVIQVQYLLFKSINSQLRSPMLASLRAMSPRYTVFFWPIQYLKMI